MSHTPPQIETRTVDSPDSGRFRHLSPVGQPESVHEISDALYEPFRGSDVRIHLAGCHIDQVPFVQSESGDYFLLNGNKVSRQYGLSLGLDQLDQRDQSPYEWTTRSNRERLGAEIRNLSRSVQLAHAADGRQWLIWCSHVHGSLMAESTGDSVHIPFSLWGARLKKGLEHCPPYHCPLQDIDTYELAADEDGTITDTGSIGVCGETKRRLSRNKMVECSESGMLLARPVASRCPVSGHWIRKPLLGSCRNCCQRVAPTAIVRGRCESCRSLTKVADRDRSRMAGFEELSGRHLWLRDARKIKMHCQPKSWLVRVNTHGANWLVVIDRAALEITSVAVSEGWRNSWNPVGQRDWPAFLNVGNPSSRSG